MLSSRIYYSAYGTAKVLQILRIVRQKYYKFRIWYGKSTTNSTYGTAKVLQIPHIGTAKVLQIPRIGTKKVIEGGRREENK